MIRPVCSMTVFLAVSLALGLLWSPPAAAEGKEWYAYPSPEKPVITAPVNNAVYQTNQQVNFTCNRMTDSDYYTEDGCNEGLDDDSPANESNYPSWTASAGDFLCGDNKGPSVTWVAPDTAQGGITVDVTDDDLPKDVVDPDWGTRNDDPVAADQITGIAAVALVLTQDHDLWWFNGANAANYYEQVTLTLEGPSQGMRVWTVTAGTDKVNFENDADTITTYDENSVGLKATAASIAQGDVTIVVKLDGTEFEGGKNITVYTPKEEVPGTITDHDFHNGVNDGYESRHNFQIKDQFGTVLPSNIELNEHWTQGAQNDHNPATSWTQFNADAWTINPAGDIDYLWACFWGASIPNTQHPQAPLGNTGVFHWGAEHYVGSLTESAGVRVLTRTWQYYRDHGRRQ